MLIKINDLTEGVYLITQTFNYNCLFINIPKLTWCIWVLLVPFTCIFICGVWPTSVEQFQV